MRKKLLTQISKYFTGPLKRWPENNIISITVTSKEIEGNTRLLMYQISAWPQ
jgi:hypothetical protein